MRIVDVVGLESHRDAIFIAHCNLYWNICDFSSLLIVLLFFGFTVLDG
jgi:hypothetical protein